jgi:8-oxo-dGTP pyrophosphatase MutT (NUDIX family)
MREKSCGAIVVAEDNTYLVMQSVTGKWGFPKGHVEAGESEFQTAQREVYEETALKVAFLDGFKEEVNYYPKPGVLKTVIFFLAVAPTKKVTCNETEHSEFRWVPYDEAFNLISYGDAKRALQKARIFLSSR